MLLPALPKPILFHPLKHHLGYLQAFVRQGKAASVSELKAAIQGIGNASQLDLYIGSSTVQQISGEVILYLQAKELLTPEAFWRYLTSEGNAYKIITLSDATDWVLRWGIIAERYVHLHPARYAAHTIRVKANVLKTAVAVVLATTPEEVPDIKLINRVRAEWLGLPPIKSFANEGGIAETVRLLLR